MSQRTNAYSNPSSTKSQESKKIMLTTPHHLGKVTRQFRVGVNLRISISQLK